MNIAIQMIFWVGVGYIWVMGVIMMLRPEEKKPQTKSGKMAEAFKILAIGMGLILISQILEQVLLA